MSSKDTSGNIFFINGTPVAWSSKKQTITAQSTCEAEYVALTTLAVTAQWIRHLWLYFGCTIQYIFYVSIVRSLNISNYTSEHLR